MLVIEICKESQPKFWSIEKSNIGPGMYTKLLICKVSEHPKLSLAMRDIS